MTVRAAVTVYKNARNSHWSLQYASGLFADRGWQRAWSALVPSAGQTLALLGNCCSVATHAQRHESAEFLRRCSANWETVYLVPGPHEISSSEGSPFFEQIDALKDVVKKASRGKDNILWMENAEHSILNKDIVILGATGWTGKRPRLQKNDIWKLPGESATRGMFEMWHEEDLEWLKERNNWWGAHHPEMRKVILTHYHPYFAATDLAESQWNDSEELCLPIESVRPILGLQPPYPAYAWLSGAGAIVASGMLRHTFLSANALQGGHYMPDRRLEIPLRRGDPPQLRPHAEHKRGPPLLQ